VTCWGGWLATGAHTGLIALEGLRLWPAAAAKRYIAGMPLLGKRARKG